MRRSVHPSRPSATTCCRVLVSKTFPMATDEHKPLVAVNVSVDGYQEMAGFEVSINGRFWLSTEGASTPVNRRTVGTLAAVGPLVSGVLIAVVGWVLTQQYNAQQLRLVQWRNASLCR